ncbi:MAG: serine/threonine-protein kinase [Bacteroidota bacterium]
MEKYIKSEDCIIHEQEEDEGGIGYYLLSQIQGTVLQVNPTIITFIGLLETARSEEELIDCIDGEMDEAGREQIVSFLKALHKLGVIRKASDPPLPKRVFRFQKGEQIGPYTVVEGITVRRWTQLYKVRQGEQQQPFVLKLFNYSPQEQSTDLIQEMLERFRAEFEIMAQLQHPNICTLYEFYAGEYPYGVMEYIEGVSLRDQLESTATLAEAEQMIEQMLAAFAYLHEKEILHGDIHYLNVLVDQQQQVKVIDFGFSYEQEHLGDENAWHAGLSHFIPPERTADHSFRLSKGMGGTRSEVFQLGVMIYYIITKQYPFTGELWEDLREAIRSQALSGVPSAYVQSLSPAREAILLRALAKTPDDRYADASALLAAWSQSL